MIFSQSQCIPPVYFFITPLIEPYSITFNSLNIDMNETQILSSAIIENNDNLLYSYPEFNGQVIYYENGILYASYALLVENTKKTYQSFLLAVNTTNGELIFKNFKFCEGISTTGLAIDQSTGDIHFLNYTSSITNENENVTADWCVWNILTNETKIIQLNATNNLITSGKIAYNTITQTLWQLDFPDRKITSFIRNNPSKNYIVNGNLSQLVINQKTGDMYVNDYFTLYLLHVNTSKNYVTTSVICNFPPIRSFTSSVGAADYDVNSNTWVLSVNGVQNPPGLPDGFYNAIDYVNLDTCKQNFYFFSNPDNSFYVGYTRFNSAQE